MPNIEIHGYGYQAFNDDETRRTVFDLRAKILNLFQKQPYFADMVVTIVPDLTVDGQIKQQPFLRLVTSPALDFNEIIELLLKLNMDIEVQGLKVFYPKKK